MTKFVFVFVFLFATNAFSGWVHTDKDMFQQLYLDGNQRKITNVIPVGEDNEYIATFTETWADGHINNYFRCVHESITMRKVGCWTLELDHDAWKKTF